MPGVPLEELFIEKYTNKQMNKTYLLGQVEFELSCTNPLGDSNPKLCNAGAVLYQLSYQANWELVVLWVDDKTVDERRPMCDVYMNFMY